MRWMWIDTVVAYEPGRRMVAVKNVSLAEEHLHDHFPGAALMPNSLIVEGMAQTAGVLCIRSLPGDVKPGLVYFLTIDKAKFRKPVMPGDVLEYHMTRLKRRKNMWWFRGEAKVGGEIVAEAELGAMIAEA